MNIKWQTLILIILILVSFSLTRIKIEPAAIVKPASPNVYRSISPVSASLLNSFAEKGFPEVNRGPSRDWNVLDPEIQAEGVLIQSLGDNFPLLRYNTYKTWPAASLTKLLTAVVVLEEIGQDKKIPISEQAVATEGESGGLKPGEVYVSRDLLKIMLLTSSNDAAAAFEEYFNGKDAFARLLNQKAAGLGMAQSIFHDAVGLSDLNESSANDLLLLLKYIIQSQPEILSWTRLQSFIVQPINDDKSRVINNIIPFVSDSNFLGGKTGTSDEAKENLVAIFSLNNRRLAVILLGSPNRVGEVGTLLKWVGEAYVFN